MGLNDESVCRHSGTLLIPGDSREAWNWRVAAVAGLLGLAAVLTGCPRHIPPPADQVLEAIELRKAVDARSDVVESARFKNARLDYFGPDGRLTVRQLLLLKKPDEVRVQTYIPGFDGVAGVLVCKCGNFAFHDRQENTYYYGKATARNIRRVVPVGLTCGDVGRVLLGGLPNDLLAELAGGTETLEWDTETGRYDLELVSGTANVNAQVAHASWVVEEIVLKQGNKEKFHYTADRAERFDGLLLPTRRRFLVDGGEQDFSLTGEEVQLNPELPETLFELSPPTGSKLRYVGQGPAPQPSANGLCTN